MRAWDDYIREVNARMQDRATGASGFLWIDEAPGRRERVCQGEVATEPARGDSPGKVPQGLIHHWFGAVFIPKATIKDVFAVLSNYDRYDSYYNPAVISAKLLDSSGSKRRFSMVLLEKAPFVTAAVTSEYNSQTFRLDDHHWYTVSYSTRIQQIDDFGRAGQHVLPPDQGSGYVWRLYSIERYEERDGGTYAELEAIALSRNIPFAIQWLAKSVVQRLPRNSMVATLEKTRDAVMAEVASPKPLPKPLEVAKVRPPPAAKVGQSATAAGQPTKAKTAAPAHHAPAKRQASAIKPQTPSVKLQTSTEAFQTTQGHN